MKLLRLFVLGCGDIFEVQREAPGGRFLGTTAQPTCHLQPALRPCYMLVLWADRACRCFPLLLSYFSKNTERTNHSLPKPFDGQTRSSPTAGVRMQLSEETVSKRAGTLPSSDKTKTNKSSTRVLSKPTKTTQKVLTKHQSKPRCVDGENVQVWLLWRVKSRSSTQYTADSCNSIGLCRWKICFSEVYKGQTGVLCLGRCFLVSLWNWLKTTKHVSFSVDGQKPLWQYAVDTYKFRIEFRSWLSLSFAEPFRILYTFMSCKTFSEERRDSWQEAEVWEPNQLLLASVGPRALKQCMVKTFLGCFKLESDALWGWELKRRTLRWPWETRELSNHGSEGLWRIKIRNFTWVYHKRQA